MINTQNIFAKPTNRQLKPLVHTFFCQKNQKPANQFGYVFIKCNCKNTQILLIPQNICIIKVK